jgi:Mn2+/Fe2+ NRAMP family transporter
MPSLKPLPKPPKLKKILGPSFILLGLGLGSGEIILWPYLTANFGLGVIWGMVIGITIQFFLNMEIERYALIHGESIFVGFRKIFKWIPTWFILSTFLGFGWPGIGLAGATLFSHILHLDNPNLLATILFILIGLILSIGKSLYKTVENLQKTLIIIGVPIIIAITLYLSSKEDVVSLARGFIGQGDGYWFLPTGMAMGTFLGALAYSGAGGNLNLAQSFYVRDKGYGMGKYAQKITNIFKSKEDTKDLRLTGHTFPLTKKNLARFNTWWRLINQEHLIVFWGLGLLTMAMLALLAFITTSDATNNHQGLNFLFNQAQTIKENTTSFIGTTFLAISALMLLSTQLGILDSTSRIITENILLMKRKPSNINKTFFIILWLQIFFGVLVFSLGFDQPQQLIILGATINAFAMFIFSSLLLYLNNRKLPEPLRPHPARNIILVSSFVFLGYFCFQTLLSYI